MENLLKNKIEMMRKLVIRIDGTPLGLSQRSGGKIDLSTSLNCDMLRYIMCISAGDGVVHEKEAEIIRNYLGYDISADEVAEYIEKYALTEADFMDRVPLTFRVLAEADVRIKAFLDRKEIMEVIEEKPESRELFIDGDERPLYVPSSIILREIFASLGECVLFSDDVVTEDENEDYCLFIERLDNYLRDELGFSEQTYADKREILARGGDQRRREGARLL